MFKLEAYVDDKYVARVMHSLTGMVMDLKVVPVVNGVQHNGSVKAKTSGDPIELLAHWLKRHHKTTVTPTDLKEFSRSIGRSEKSYSLYLTGGIKAKLLKKSGSGNNIVYQVLS